MEESGREGGRKWERRRREVGGMMRSWRGERERRGREGVPEINTKTREAFIDQVSLLLIHIKGQTHSVKVSPLMVLMAFTSYSLFVCSTYIR